MLILLVALFALTVLALLVLVALAVAADRRIMALLRAGPPRPKTPLRVLAANNGSVTLPRHSLTTCPGRYGLVWEGGSAQVDALLASDARTVTRRLVESSGPPIGITAYWHKYVFHGDPLSALGLPYENLLIPGPLGLLPAWYLAGSRRTWVLLAHGRGGTREEALRVLRALQALGFPCLVLGYRNDAGAPASPDGLYHLGDSEWEDLDAAAGHALDQGAEGLVMYGWSMGGAMVECLLQRSPRAAQVRAAVLDAPLLAPVAALEAKLLAAWRLPAWLGRMLMAMATRRSGIDFAGLDHRQRTDRPDLPTLLFHGSADGQVPVAGSDAFAACHARVVRYVRVEGAGHALAWNADPTAYEQALAAFLDKY